MMMLAETPLAEREEEKRYRLRYVTPPLLKSEYTKPKYFYIRRIDGYADTSVSQTNDSTFKTIFTESEIAEMDITGVSESRGAGMKIRVYFKNGGEILVIGKWAENFYVNLVASAESKFPFVDVSEGMAIAIDSIEMYTTHLEEEAE